MNATQNTQSRKAATQKEGTTMQKQELSANITAQNLESLKVLPLLILFRIKLTINGMLEKWRDFFNRNYHPLFFPTFLEQMKGIVDTEERQARLSEQQRKMEGIHLSDNENLYLTYVDSCEHCDVEIVVGNKEIGKCPTCGKKLSSTLNPMNSFSFFKLYSFLRAESYNWNPDGFHYVEKEDGTLFLVFPMIKYEEPTEVELFEETETFLDVAMNSGHYVHIHANTNPEKVGEEGEYNWSVSCIPLSSKSSLSPMASASGDAFDLLSLPAMYNREDYAEKLCPRCGTKNNGWHSYCWKCNLDFPRAVKPFSYNDYAHLDAKSVYEYRCPVCKVPVTDRNLETGERILECWSCEAPLRWNADERCDVHPDTFHRCGNCDYLFSGQPSNCPCCFITLQWDDEAHFRWHECPGCMREFKGMPDYCPHCQRGLSWNGEKCTLQAKLRLVQALPANTEVFECGACRGQFVGRLKTCPHAGCASPQTYEAPADSQSTNLSLLFCPPSTPHATTDLSALFAQAPTVFCPCCTHPLTITSSIDPTCTHCGTELVECEDCGELMPAFYNECSACGHEHVNNDYPISQVVAETLWELAYSPM